MNFARLRRYLPDGSNPGRPVCLTPETFAALLDVAEAADALRRCDETYPDLETSQAALGAALDRLLEVVGNG